MVLNMHEYALEQCLKTKPKTFEYVTVLNMAVIEKVLNIEENALE